MYIYIHIYNMPTIHMNVSIYIYIYIYIDIYMYKIVDAVHAFYIYICVHIYIYIYWRHGTCDSGQSPAHCCLCSSIGLLLRQASANFAKAANNVFIPWTRSSCALFYKALNFRCADYMAAFQGILEAWGRLSGCRIAHFRRTGASSPVHALGFPNPPLGHKIFDDNLRSKSSDRTITLAYFSTCLS